MITPQEVLAFIDQVQGMRDAQDLYKRTVDSRLRYEIPKLQEKVDARATELVSALNREITEGLHGPGARPVCPNCGAELTDFNASAPWCRCSTCGSLFDTPPTLEAFRAVVEDLARIPFGQKLDEANLVTLIARARVLVGPVTDETGAIVPVGEKAVLALAQNPDAYGPKVAVTIDPFLTKRKGGAS